MNELVWDLGGVSIAILMFFTTNKVIWKVNNSRGTCCVLINYGMCNEPTTSAEYSREL